MAKATLIATLAAPPTPEELSAIRDSVEWVEVRADLTGDINPDWLRRRFPGRLLYSLRTTTQGGGFEGSDQERKARLTNAARHYDLIDLEGHRDLSAEVLNKISAAQRLISWSGSASRPSSLETEFVRLSSVKAQFYKLVTVPERPGDDLVPLCFLKSLGRSDVLAFSTGDIGFWTRLLAPHYGSPQIFGAANARQQTPGEPTIKQLIDDYGLPELPEPEVIYGIVGSPVRHSLSPRLHNAAYRAAGRRALFVPFQVESFDDFWSEVVTSQALASLGLSIRGLTVASPHKEAALKRAGIISPMVQRACSSNVLARRNGDWIAETTDPEGVVLALAEREIDVRGKRTAIVGCGGAGRAVAAALQLAGAEVTLVNRGLERGDWASKLLGLPLVRLSQFSARHFSLIVNATPVGRHDHETPFAIDNTDDDAVIVDLVYGKEPTALITAAVALNREAIDGRDVLMIQVRQQFRLMTGHEMPEELVREALGNRSRVACQALARP